MRNEWLCWYSMFKYERTKCTHKKDYDLPFGCLKNEGDKERTERRLKHKLHYLEQKISMGFGNTKIGILRVA